MLLKFYGGPFDGLEITQDEAPPEFRLPKPSRVERVGKGATSVIPRPGAIEFFSVPPLVSVYRRFSAPDPDYAHYQHVPEVQRDETKDEKADR